MSEQNKLDEIRNELKLLHKASNNPWKPVLLYFIFGFLWILLSDNILAFLIPDPTAYAQFQTIKGSFYVVITTVLMYSLVRMDNRKLIRASQQNYQMTEALIEAQSTKDLLKSELNEKSISLNDLVQTYKAEKDFSDVIFRESNASIVVWNLEGYIVDANQAFMDLTGYGEEIIGMNWLKTTVPDDEVVDIEAVVQDIIKYKRVANCENGVKAKDGSVLRVIWNDVLIDNPHEPGKLVLAFGIDVTKERAQEHKMMELVYTDDLTNSPNRMAFEHDLIDVINEEQLCTIFLLGVRQFKRLNEIHGHRYGDQFLIQYSRALKNNFSAVKFYRWGGDEFIGILKSTDEETVHGIIQNILTITNQKWTLGGVEYNPRINMGIVSYPRDGRTSIELFKNVYIALQSAKDLRDKCYQFYNEGLLKDIEIRNQIEKELDHALDNDLLELYFQPIYQITSRKTHGYEVLLRWNNPNVKHIGEVISIAEQSGQIRKIDNWVLKNIFSIIGNYFKETNLHFAINLSAQTVNAEDLFEKLEGLKSLYGVNPKQIELEITEYSVMDNVEEAIETINSIKALGFAIALDDFGTRFSSLNYISKMPFDILKIDKSYIDYIIDNRKDRMIVDQIIALSNKLGLKTVAEGIETKEQENQLREMGCHFGQGYYFSKPMPFEKMLEEVSEQKL